MASSNLIYFAKSPMQLFNPPAVQYRLQVAAWAIPPFSAAFAGSQGAGVVVWWIHVRIDAVYGFCQLLWVLCFAQLTHEVVPETLACLRNVSLIIEERKTDRIADYEASRIVMTESGDVVYVAAFKSKQTIFRKCLTATHFRSWRSKEREYSCF